MFVVLLYHAQKEINKSKRLLVFLSKLSELRDHSAFRKFISVLERSGYSDIASALRADISKIHFGEYMYRLTQDLGFRSVSLIK